MAFFFFFGTRSFFRFSIYCKLMPGIIVILMREEIYNGRTERDWFWIFDICIGFMMPWCNM